MNLSVNMLAALLVGTIAAVGLLLILNIALWIKVNGLKRKVTRRKIGANEQADVVTEIESELAKLHETEGKHEQILQQVQTQLKAMKSKVGIYRYNAFAERGSDLSFSIAILNEADDGIVISGIHNRDNMYVYAKPIKDGKSTYQLSPEELKAIEQAS